MKKILIGLIVIVLLASIVSALPVFPGAEGFGSETVAGRGGTVIRVTNLEASGSGSLRECVQATGPRVCVFEVSGNIPIFGGLAIMNPYITIAGQTAPSPGITLQGTTFGIHTHDVLVQHIRIRTGDSAQGYSLESRDAVKISKVGGRDDVYNVVFDHCSVSWGLDENIAITQLGTHDITVSNCIASEGLNNSIHPKGAHSKGIMVAYNAHNASIIRNLFAHNVDRNPHVVDSKNTIIVNNIVYNSRYNGADFSHNEGLGEERRATVIGNSHFSGPNSRHAHHQVLIGEGITDVFRLYVEDNECEYRTADPWSCVNNDAPDYVIKETSPPIWVDSITVMPSAEAYEWVLDNAGARPADRDSVDIRAVSTTRNRNGNLVNTPSEVGGWPVLAENHRTLTLPSNPSGDNNGNGYTNLEEWLHGYSAQVEGKSGTPPPPPPPPPPQEPEYIWLEAEDSQISSPMQKGTDARASNGEYIFTPASTPDTSNPQTEASLSFSIPQIGEYYLWAGLYAENKESDASYIGFNGNFDRAYPENINNYEWIRVEETHNSGDYTHSLNQGQNIINTGHGEGGAIIDRYLITNQENYIPPSYGEPLEGDLNNDGYIDLSDLIIVAKNFGLTSGFDSRADTDSNNVIDIFDVVFVASRFT